MRANAFNRNRRLLELGSAKGTQSFEACLLDLKIILCSSKLVKARCFLRDVRKYIVFGISQDELSEGNIYEYFVNC